MKGDAEILQSGRVILWTTLRLCILYRRRRRLRLLGSA
ncbi:ORFL249C [Human betaherpesvirus 5]|nr:ORFL249C [Human betaherpesvirus 5]QHX40621.1 ORFL249C [Human betaherpesvirus 5]